MSHVDPLGHEHEKHPSRDMAYFGRKGRACTEYVPHDPANERCG